MKLKRYESTERAGKESIIKARGFCAGKSLLGF